MTRRVGFGDEPPNGGGFSWTVPLIVVAVAVTAGAVLDPDLIQNFRDITTKIGGDTLTWAFAIAAILAAFWAVRIVLKATFRGERRSRADLPPVRGRSPPQSAETQRPSPKQVDARPAPASPRQSNAPAMGQSRAGGCFAIVFLLFWLTGWTAGIVFAAGAFFSDFGSGAVGPHWFLLIWIVFAVFGWFVAIRMLLSLIRGVFAAR